MNTKPMFPIIKLAFLSLMFIAVVPAVGNAVTFTVNSQLDTAGLQGNCTSGTGTCTLRSAIQAANASGAADIINLPAGTYTLTIPGAREIAAATGDLNITGLGGALIINGAGAATTIIDGNALDGVFETRVGAVVTISDVTIRNGNNINGLGGGIHVGNGTTLTLNRSVVTACKAGGGKPGGGGIDNSGTLHMNTVAVTKNESVAGGVNNGAAGNLDWFIGELSDNGINPVTSGGGIQNNGTITMLENITISGNRSAGQGAGIDSRGTVALQNVTLSGNTSAAGILAIGGIRNNAGISITVRNTIIAGNLPANCGGTITSQGNNLDNGTTCGFVAGVSGNLPGTDPLLGALALNGGALQTIALPAGSPAIDKGSATVCPATDARGIVRPVDGNIILPANVLDGVATCDIGAYEFRPQKITVTLASPFDFGTVTSATTSDHTITLANAGDGALNIAAIAATDLLTAPFSIPIDTCSGQTLLRAGSCSFTTRFAPATAVLSFDNFDIPSNDPLTPSVVFALSGTGTAIAVPLISVTDSIAPFTDQQVPFGGVLVGASADATITVTNTGTADLVIGTIASADPLATPFSILNDVCSGKTITPSATCTLTVRFAPTANGPASNTFNIPSNVAGALPLTMTVSGTGGTSPTTPGTANNPPPNPVLVSPTNGQTGVPATMTFTWKKSLDPDGDAVTYHLMYSTDPTFAVSQTVDVASAKAAGLLFAGLGSMGGGIILFGFVSGSGMKRSRKLLLVIPALLLTGVLFTACGGGGSSSTTTNPPGTTAADSVSTTVTGLAAAKTYYWKVVADDGKGGLATSETFSFKTQ